MTPPRSEAERRRRLVEALGVELELADLELALLEAERADGLTVAGAARGLYPHEYRAAVRFAELDRIVTDAAALIARRVGRVREHVLDGLANELAPLIATEDPYEALRALGDLTDPTRPDTIPGLPDVVEEVAAQVREDLLAAARAGHAEAIAEGRRQGLPDRLLPVDDDPVDDRVRAAAEAHSRRAARQPAERLLAVAAEAGQRAATARDATGTDVLAAALEAADEASPAGTEDVARQAANVAHGLGRARAQAAMPAPREVYASELLDRNTCGPCATVDGRTYESLEAALVDYPGAGGFVGCDGGSRCRGTLVLVHADEAEPTLDGPGDGRGGGAPVPDRTPRGPASNAPAEQPAGTPHVDLPGLPRDPGMPEPPAPVMTLDDAGAVVPPAATAEPVPVPVEPPAAAPADLADLFDAELEDALNLAVREGRWDDATRFGDELDRRAGAGDVGPANPDAEVLDYTADLETDPDTLARWAAEQEAYEEAGGIDVAAVFADRAAAGGRAIDRVRAAWDAEALRAQVEAEEVATVLLRRDRLAEFQAKYGTNTAVLFTGPARVAYYYASRELRDYWEAKPRSTFAEFAVASGITDRKMVERARTAAEARWDAAMRADESPEARRERKRERDRQRRRRNA